MPSPEGGDVPPIEDNGAAEPAASSEPLAYDESYWPEDPERPPIESLPHSAYDAKVASAVKGLREVGGMQNECSGFAARFLGQALNHLNRAQYALSDIDEPTAMAHLSFADVHIRRALEKPPQGWRSEEYASEREEGRRTGVCLQAMHEALYRALEWTLEDLALARPPDLSGSLGFIYDAAHFGLQAHAFYRADQARLSRQRLEEPPPT